MSRRPVRAGPRWRRLGEAIESLTRPAYRRLHELGGSYTLPHRYAQDRLAAPGPPL